MRDTLGLENITLKIEKSIRKELDKCGLMYRIFSRVKTKSSIDNKIENKEYRQRKKKITDIIGIRVTLYFRDDVDLVYKILKHKSNFDHESIDSHTVDEFKPVRCNLTFNIEDEHLSDANAVIGGDIDVIDLKYEVQIRTVLSEGWHEVEHDLRYKCKDDWTDHNDLSRNLNGIFATLETSEFSMLQMFDVLAHRHYKNNKIVPLIKTKFRIRLTNEIINEDLMQLLSCNQELMKKIYRVDRNRFFSSLINSKITIPLTIDNLIFLINHFEIDDPKIRGYENDFLKGEFAIE